MAQQQHIEQLRSSPSRSAEDNENAESFSAVLSTLDREQLLVLVSAMLQRLQPLTNAKFSVSEPLWILPRTFSVDL